MAMTLEQFGQTVKRKYPQYNDIPDAELGKRMMEKYPQYRDMVDTQPTTRPTDELRSGVLSNPILRGLEKTGETFGEIGTGALKGAGSTIRNVLSLSEKAGAGLRRIAGNVMGMKAEDIGAESPQQTLAEEFIPESAVTPSNTAQKVGFAGEQLAELLAPGSKASKLVNVAEKGVAKAIQGTGKGAQILRNLVNTAARSGIAATEGAGTTFLQSGGDLEETKRNALISGAIPIIGGLWSAGKAVPRWLSRKIESVLVKPTAQDVRQGFKVDNIFKYDLGGSLQKSAEKVHTAISKRANQLRQLVKDNPAELDVVDIFQQAEDELLKNRAKTLGMNNRIRNALDNLFDETAAITRDGKMDVSDAQQIKRSLGKLGAWLNGSRDPEANAMETVSNALYSKFKKAIEDISPKELQTLNQELSELIPIEMAMIRRIPVAERNNVVSLSDLTSLLPAFKDTGNLWLFALNRVLKSGIAANLLNRLGTQRPATGLRALIRGAGEGIGSK